MRLKKLLTATVFALLAGSAFAGPLSVSNGQFIKDGKPYYGVGINYHDAFARYAANGNDMTWKTGLATLKSYNVPFIRIGTTGFYPNDINANYLNRKAVFYARLDAFMDEAAAQGIGVVLDLFFNWTAYADIKGEHMPAWGDHNSETRKLMRSITTEIVTRYKDHRALWAWEFANEANALMDLPNDNSQWMPSSPANQSPLRTTADNIVPATIINALADFATTVRSIDSRTPIFSGNDRPQQSAYHLSLTPLSWAQDTPAQFGAMMSRNDPAPLDTLSIHLYQTAEGKYFGSLYSTYNDIIAAAMAQSAIDGRPLFLGEFGAIEVTATAGNHGKFDQVAAAILANRVQMSSLWVYDLTHQNATWNITTTNARAYQLDAIKTMNEKMGHW
ncbi:cellulase family glycosylhydrolase [Rugamonas sp. CCM 8940]|uniref:cellulase family glycosylhydrolase n=1 Tax=Rugamonas sp. CCM 8940 TaxID=2765359 RepID=UPI0018F4F8A0|nr:cellulase family glycosylhydrolase [Rugamonas sp. CCM 8940]MBJ7310029.1 cellulase family glycosylhydrolase [Rugamonas sp. CCM 8940]